MKKEEIIKDGIFIANVEAVDIINHIERERNINLNYVGVLPYSLESMHLAGLEDFNICKYVNADKNIYNRMITKDVINIKFSCSQMDKAETIDYIEKKFTKRILKIKKYYKKKKNEYQNRMEKYNKKEYDKMKKIIEYINNDTEHEYKKRSAEDIRPILYDGFTIKNKIYPVLTKSHEKYNQEIDNSIRELNKKLKKEKDEQKIIDIDNQIKSIYDSLEVEIISTNYKMWKRSSSKSRTGQILFIKESLLEEMNRWGRMMLNIPIDEIGFDVVGFSSYSSLVGSHIERTIKIKPSNILIVRDVLSCFDIPANVVRKETIKINKRKDNIAKPEILQKKDKMDCKAYRKFIIATIKIKNYRNEIHLKVYKETTTIKSSLYDGQSILDSSYFEKGQSMMLLRQHFFKSASFNGNVIQFLKDWYKDKYDTAEVKDMFGNRMRVNQVHMLITPNSLKALKFSKYVNENNNGTEKEMYDYWKKIVKQDECIFGVCKHEKASKQGTDEHGDMIQQMSYQHINSLRATKNDMRSLLNWEVEYINNAKNDVSVYKDLLLRDANFSNSNEMLAELCDTDYIHTEMFRTQRTKNISKYVRKIKGGKVKIAGADNCVIIGNPYLMLLSATGELEKYGTISSKNELILNDDYIDETLPISKDYISCNTKMFEDEKMLVTFRNPHTSPMNCGLSKNFRKENNLIDKYFNFSKNIIAVNLVRTEFQNIHSDSDQDSDFVLCSNLETLVEIVKRSFRKDLVCINEIPNQPNKYKFTNKDMALMDSKLSQSKDIIGTVVNLGQLAMSEYYHTINSTIDKLKEQKFEGFDKKTIKNIIRAGNKVVKGVRNFSKNEVDRLKRLEDIVIIMTILSGCAIDNAKRTYDIDMQSEINHVENSKDNEGNKLISKKPMFWEYVSDSIKEKNENIREKNKEIKNENKRIRKLNRKNKKDKTKTLDYFELKTTKMKCPMEYIGEILSDKNIIPKAEADTENGKEFDEIINEVSGKARGGVIETIIKLAIKLDEEIVKYHSIKKHDKEEQKRQAVVLENTLNGIIEQIQKRKINEKTMQMILKNHIGEEESNVYYKTRLMNVLYTNNKNTFRNLFHKSN